MRAATVAPASTSTSTHSPKRSVSNLFVSTGLWIAPEVEVQDRRHLPMAAATKSPQASTLQAESADAASLEEGEGRSSEVRRFEEPLQRTVTEPPARRRSPDAAPRRYRPIRMVVAGWERGGDRR
jgi:hypothetical protein